MGWRVTKPKSAHANKNSAPPTWRRRIGARSVILRHFRGTGYIISTLIFGLFSFSVGHTMSRLCPEIIKFLCSPHTTSLEPIPWRSPKSSNSTRGKVKRDFEILGDLHKIGSGEVVWGLHKNFMISGQSLDMVWPTEKENGPKINVEIM